MADDAAATAAARAAIGVLTDLTPATNRRDRSLTVPLDWFRWLDAPGLDLFAGTSLADVSSFTEQFIQRAAPDDPPATYVLDRKLGERLAAVQQVREGRNAIRVGWLWLAGTADIVGDDGASVQRRIFQPLVHRTVRVVRSHGSFGWQLTPHGDPEITPLVRDRDVAHQLEDHIQTGGGAFSSFSELTSTLFNRLTRLQSFAQRCANAAGHPGAPFVLERPEPQDAMEHRGVRLIVGIALYATEEVERTTRAGSLAAWPPEAFAEHTAFRTIYGGPSVANESSDRRLESVVPLTPRQAEVVEAARCAQLTVVSGAPGTGKSHTLTSIVCDAVQGGESVLLAAKNEAAVDALMDLLARQPGVTPVVFGSTERRARLAKRLESGELRPAPRSAIQDAKARLDDVIRARDEAVTTARSTLLDEWLASPSGGAALARARTLVPRLLEGPVPGLDDALRRATAGGGGWFRRRSARRAQRRICRALGAPADASFPDIVDAMRLLRSSERSMSTVDACATVVMAQQQVHDHLTEWLALDMRSDDRLDRAGLATIATLATALRSGRNARRVQLERLRDRTLTRALPVWVGTLGDVDDLLPMVPGLFDLVLIDEASATEQTSAASALLRARRAVVVGDPRQLRHVSFLGDDTIAEAMDRHGVDASRRSQLDVRRNSLFDAAASASAMLVLDEHFRSAPHLIDVVARSIYDGHLRIATRTPISERVDCVHLHPTVGTRSSDGVVAAEVSAVISELVRMRSFSRSVGVVTPFRAQADALEAAILEAFSSDDLLRMAVRVGTVHSFQGHERDDVVCSLGLVDDDRAGWSFVKDSHLLAVMLTRARRTMTVIASCNPEPTSLLGAYLAAADSPPGEPAPATALGAWPRTVVDELRRAGVAVAEAYPAGRHVVDAALVAAHRPVGVICDLHPGGIDAHIRRHLDLMRAGWTIVDALPSRWADSLAELTIEIVRLAAGPESPP